ncbi:MAG: DNA polymerase III subunit beta [Desulfovibrio sp.]|jgi:DNA polymerase-3 subunit beta|nr:DNA polymerase III subunit beta [Desulfovibrio sp.]
MLVTVYKEEIIDGLQKAANIIPQRTGAAYLRSIWLRAASSRLEILSTDSNIEFRGSYAAGVQQEGLAGVPGRHFVELLKRLPSGELTLRVDETASVMHIDQGRRKYKLAVNDATWFQQFAEFPDTGAVLWSGDFLQELIDRIAYCIGDEGADALSCFLLKPAPEERIEASGMNGHQFAMYSFTNEDLRALLPEDGILIQKKYLNELKKWLGGGEIYLNTGEKRLFLRDEAGREFFSMPLSSYQYPDYTVFISRLKESGISRLTLPREETQNALQRIALFNTESNMCAYFDLSAHEVVMTAQGQDFGSASETLDASYEGGIGKIAFPTGNLLNIIDHYTSRELNLSMTGSEGPCGIRGDEDKDYLVILMPMKIVDEVGYSEEQA